MVISRRSALSLLVLVLSLCFATSAKAQSTNGNANNIHLTEYSNYTSSWNNYTPAQNGILVPLTTAGNSEQFKWKGQYMHTGSYSQLRVYYLVWSVDMSVYDGTIDLFPEGWVGDYESGIQTNSFNPDKWPKDITVVLQGRNGTGNWTNLTGWNNYEITYYIPSNQ